MGEALEAKGGWCRITPGTTFSNHYPVIGHFQLHRTWGPFQPRISHTIYTVTEVKEQLVNQWSLPVNASLASDKLLAKLTRASTLLHKIVKTRSKDAHEKRQRTKWGLIALQRLQQRYPTCSWIAGQVVMAKHELIMAEKTIYDMEFHGSMAWWI